MITLSAKALGGVVWELFAPFGASAMGEVKHLCLVKFKEEVLVDDILQGMTKLVSEMDMVKSFEWGKDVLNQEMLTQGFTHVFSLTFASSEDLTSYMSHERHQEFAGTFMAAIDKVVVIDFPAVVAKPAPPAAPPGA
uniref:Stress-response A/B barrel domain-containing protein n=1 Tax=Oryza brachyantha TaxID=4533 RepID=J3N621_ORYBR